jgi:hypothetical protein
MNTTITRDARGIDLRAPAPRIKHQWLVVASWLPFVIAASVATYITVGSFSSMIAKGQWIAAVLFSGGAVIVLVGCIVGTINSIYGWFGTEYVHVDSDGITIYQELGPLRVRQQYPPYRIRNVRAFVPGDEWGQWTPPPARVIFDTPGRVKGFGSSLTQQQAARIASEVSELLGPSAYERPPKDAE